MFIGFQCVANDIIFYGYSTMVSAQNSNRILDCLKTDQYLSFWTLFRRRLFDIATEKAWQYL